MNMTMTMTMTSNDLAQIVNFSIWIPVTLTVLLFGFIYFFWLSFHCKILIMWLSQFLLTFHQTQNWDAPFHYIAYDYSRAD